MRTLLTFVLEGPPRTKKNSGRRLKRGNRVFSVPSEAYENWNASAQQQFMEIRAKAKIPLPITSNVNIKALFFRQKAAGDAVGFYQALADSMQDGGIVKNDVQVVAWDGTRILKDADNPRIIVQVQEFTE